MIRSLRIGVGTAIKTGLAVGITGVALVQPYRPMVFVGRSMEPTYRNGSVVLTKSVCATELHHGQVVVIDTDTGPIVKRIAFLPGDKYLQMRSGNTWLDMIYVHPPRHNRALRELSRMQAVPDGMVYVLGDNDKYSDDSREFGPVSMSRIRRTLVDQRHFNPFADGWMTPPG